MITEQDLQEQIERYQGQYNITPEECVKLAAMYIIKDNLIESPTYSTAPPETAYNSKTEFGGVIQGKSLKGVLGVFDELMEATYVYNKPLYLATIERLRETA